MKAAVLAGIEQLCITELPVPKCGNGDVLVKVEACGVCRTDMKAYFRGQRDLRMPRVLGHEVAGVIAETGRDVVELKVGDGVQIAPGVPCGECRFCRGGLDNMCNSVQILGFHLDGGFAEYVLVPEKGVRYGVLNKIPENLSFGEAALTEPLACSINMQDSLNVGPLDTVVVFGAGPLGIINAKLARYRGAKSIVLIEINENRLSGAEKLFDYYINPLHEDPLQRILELTDGNGADAVIPCCPGPEAFFQAINVLGKRGRFGFFSGIWASSHDLQADLNLIHYRELTMKGAYGCSAKHNRAALKLLGNGQIDIGEMITRYIGLDDINRGIKAVAAMEETKIVISFN